MILSINWEKIEHIYVTDLELSEQKSWQKCKIKRQRRGQMKKKEQTMSAERREIAGGGRKGGRGEMKRGEKPVECDQW